MYIPREATTIAAALSNALVTSPASVPTLAARATGPLEVPYQGVGPVGPVIDAQLVHESPLHKPSLKIETPELPFPFRPESRDSKYFGLDKGRLEGCIREAIQALGRDRWAELTENDGWTDFLIKTRDGGWPDRQGDKDHYMYADTNTVSGAQEQIRFLSQYDYPDLDAKTNDTELCNCLVKRYFGQRRPVDEIIMRWAMDEGYFKNLPPTSAWGPRGNLTSPRNSTFDGDETFNMDGVCTVPNKLSFNGNLTTHGKPVVRRSLDSASDDTKPDVHESTATGDDSFPEMSVEDSKNALVASMKMYALLDQDIEGHFGWDPALIESFFDQPRIRERLYQAIKDHPAGGRGDFWLNQQSLVAFIKNFIVGGENWLSAGTGP